MASNNGVFITDHLKHMIRKYAANPDAFFLNGDGNINLAHIDRLIGQFIDTNPKSNVRSGQARIRGTRRTVCDIIVDTWFQAEIPEGGVPKAYLLGQQYPDLPPEAIDAAYAFLMRNHDRIARECETSFGHALPKDLY
ncbi:DUF433 domain-containing protein [Candidatus Woesearchaeota archaeon]|nr:DUF433 domain-containing protein [Candidatus Woesearchaeota archaeon]MBW3006222.1 DUF433 domain-containing protein [Candidatus Woesearchaeota archaeon]